MHPNTNVKTQFDNSSSNKRYGYSKYEIYNNDFSKKEKLSEVKIMETDSGYHFEIKIPGYIKDDFNFYVCKNDLVVTTEKRNKLITNQTEENKVQRHSYCYPSALFKRTFALPKDIVRDEIIVDYNNEILRFDLIKSITSN